MLESFFYDPYLNMEEFVLYFVPKPWIAAARYMISTEVAECSISQPKICGIFTNIKDFFLPRGPEISPDSALPSGWHNMGKLAEKNRNVRLLLRFIEWNLIRNLILRGRTI